jgi:SET domain-containing protein
MLHPPAQQKKLISDLFLNVYCRIKPSSIQGIGVFAIRDIPKHTNPFRIFGTEEFVPFPLEEVEQDKEIHPNVIKYAKDVCAIQDGQIWLNARGLNSIPLSYFLNHSETPNMVEQNEGEEFIAARDIKEGEELTVDYRTYNDKMVFE